MIVEQRTYTLHSGKTKAYLDYYEKNLIAVQTKHLPRMIGYFFTEIGPLNQIVHMWGYEDLAERTRRREQLIADPAWISGAAELTKFILNMETKILVPASFSPIR